MTELTSFGRNLLVFRLYGQAGAHESDSHDRPHQLQRSFELHETRRLIDQNPTGIVELGWELAGNLAEPLLNHADLRSKGVLRRLTRQVSDLDGSLIYGMQLHVDDLGGRSECEHAHRFIDALLKVLRYGDEHAVVDILGQINLSAQHLLFPLRSRL